MRRETTWKALGSGMLALSLIISPLAGANAMAAEVTEPVTTDNPEGGSVKDIDPTREAKDAVGTEGEEGYIPAKPAYEDTEIPVWGFTEDATVYSVDVEWGAMTFQWENSSWDPVTHMKKTGAGWKVYDSVNDKVLATETEAVNRIAVTNHSNADIWALFDYTGADGYSDTSGTFSKKADDADTQFDAGHSLERLRWPL